MNQETNDFLTYNLNDAHNIFNGIIKEMEEANIPYHYNTIKEAEINSFEIVKDIIVKMNNEVYEYNNLIDDNKDLFDEKAGIYIKYISLYIVSILFIKMYHKLFSLEKFNELWHYLVGLFLGSTFIGLLNKDLNEVNNGTKDRRDLINRLKTLKEEYKQNHDKAVNEINYLFALNDNLWEELDKQIVLVKNK